MLENPMGTRTSEALAMYQRGSIQKASHDGLPLRSMSTSYEFLTWYYRLYQYLLTCLHTFLLSYYFLTFLLTYLPMYLITYLRACLLTSWFTMVYLLCLHNLAVAGQMLIFNPCSVSLVRTLSSPSFSVNYLSSLLDSRPSCTTIHVHSCSSCTVSNLIIFCQVLPVSLDGEWWPSTLGLGRRSFSSSNVSLLNFRKPAAARSSLSWLKDSDSSLVRLVW